MISGDLNVQGTKNFKIDHPLDPENKYLLHAAIESSEVLNIYSGNVTTNENGEAIVTLPNWFEAMNLILYTQRFTTWAEMVEVVTVLNAETIQTNISKPGKGIRRAIVEVDLPLNGAATVRIVQGQTTFISLFQSSHAGDTFRFVFNFD